MTQSDERTLVGAARDGDVDAFEKLVRRYQNRLYNLILRNVYDAATASDITQDVFIQVYKALDTFDQQAQFSTWVYRIAMNAVYSHHRHASAKKRGGDRKDMSLSEEHAPDPAMDSRNPARSSDAPEDVLARQESHQRVLDAIEELDAEQRQVVTLRDIEGLSYEEIAEVLEINVGTVRSRLFRARDRLRGLLADLVDEI